MQIILSVICFFLFLPVITAVGAREDKRNKDYKRRRQTERMLRQTMEDVRRGGHY